MEGQGPGHSLPAVRDQSCRSRCERWTTLSPRLLGNWRVGDEFRVTEHRQRRRQMQLFGSAHAYLIGEAFQGFDRDRRRRYLVDQDLLGLVCRELPDAVIAADQ